MANQESSLALLGSETETTSPSATTILAPTSPVSSSGASSSTVRIVVSTPSPNNNNRQAGHTWPPTTPAQERSAPYNQIQDYTTERAGVHPFSPYHWAYYNHYNLPIPGSNPQSNEWTTYETFLAPEPDQYSASDHASLASEDTGAFSHQLSAIERLVETPAFSDDTSNSTGTDETSRPNPRKKKRGTKSRLRHNSKRQAAWNRTKRISTETDWPLEFGKLPAQLRDMWHDKLAADKKAYLESIQIPDGLKDMWRAKVDAGRKKKNKKKWIPLPLVWATAPPFTPHKKGKNRSTNDQGGGW